MKISVIIPTLNESSVLADCLQSVCNAEPEEVLVVDGGSRDQTVAIACKWGCRVLYSPPGRARQQNWGARLAGGDVLLFLHADSQLPPDGLRQIRKVLGRRRIAAGAFRHRIQARGLLYRLIERGNLLRARVLQLPYGDQGIFVRRETFWQIGGFPEVGLMEDVLLVRRLRRRSSLAILPGPLQISARRWQQYGVARQTLRNWLLTAAERLGVSPDRLARYYPSCPGGSNGDLQPGQH